MQFKHVLGAIFFLLISVKGFSQPVAPAFSTSTVAPFTNPNLTSFVIDYNNDGVDDIVGFTTQYANTGKLWKNNGNGTFSDVSSTVTFSNYNWTGALDFDRNGLMDVYQLTGDTLRISFNTATGFTTPDANCGYYLLSNLFGTAATSIFNSIIGDYDGDGVYDILSQVVIGTSTKINAVKGQLGCVSGCSFKFPSQTASTLVSLSNATNTLFQLADIDNDFDMDLLVGRGVRYQNFTYSIYKKSATGYTLFSGSGYDVGRHSGFGMLGEFNNDGRTDIVSGAEDCCVAAGDALYVYYSNPNGTYTANNSAMLRNASEDPYYFKATIIDINLDKTQDIIWTEMSAINTSKTQVFLNDNFSTFTESSAAMNLHNGYTNGLCCPITLFTRATVLDINNDKKPDVNIAQIDELSPFSNTNNWQRINTTTNNSVKLKLIACNGLKEGWGARIRYKVGGVWYYQQHNAYSSSGYPFLYLGMGSATSIETIEVTWFGGAVTTTSAINAGEFKVMEENPNCTNDALSSFSFNSLSDTTTNCGLTATLSGPAGFASYSWNNGATTQSISATANGVYKLTVTNNSGCNAYDSTYLSLVKSDIFQNNSTICKGTIVLLSVDSSFAAQNLNGINLLPSNLKVGLKAYYPFSGNANDASGNNNNGTVTGATLTTDRFGNANSAYSFNGSSFIDLGNIAGVGYSTTQDITMSFWINEGASGTVISKYTNLDAANSNFFISKATSTAQLAGNGTNSLTANNLTDYRWANYVFIAASGSNKSFLYRNGVLVATGTLYTNATLSATKIMLGKLMGSPSNFFTGKIDDVFIYNRALTASEVSQLSNFQPKVSWSTGATTNTISVTPSVTTKYFVTITDGINSCKDSVTITVDDIGVYNPFSAQSSTCGTTKSLDAGAGYTSYLWSTGATSQTISPTLNGNYSVTVTNAAGCSASDTVTVSLLNADIIQSNQTVCANTTLNLFIDSTFSGSAINAKSQMSANLQTGLVAFYPFTGNASDVSGNNNVLTANGVTLTTDRFGRSNSAYSFTNTQTSVTNYLKAVNPTPFAKNTYTISAWFNSRQFYPNIGGVTYNYQSIVFYSPQWYVYGPAYHLALQHANNSVLEGGNWTATNTNQAVTTANGSIAVNQWYHVVLSFDGTTIKMYKDGQLVASRAGTISFANQVQFLIGGGGDGPSPGGIYGGFNGKIDDVGFWDRALTTNEVQELYNGRPSVLWSTGATTNKISVTPTTTTKYFATLTDGIGTCKDSVTITVDELSGFNPLQDTIKVCGDSTVLDAGAGYATYNWSNGATTRLITAKSSGKYYITVATAAGCSASDTSIVSIVKANIIQSDTTICRGGTIQLSVDTLVRGLLAYYPLDNNAQDLSGNNMNGTVTGASPTTDRFGQANKAYFFNGTSDFIKVNHDTRLNRLPLTVSCWFNANQQISPSGALVGKYYAGSWSGWQLTLNETGTSSKRLDPWYIRNSGNYVKNNSATPNFYTTQIIDSSWHHVAFVIDSTSGKIYLDGALQATAAWVGSAGIPANTWPMYFGYYPSGNAQPNVYYYRGKIDDIRLYDKALNNTEVQSAMSNSITNIQYLWSNGATTATIQVNPIVTTKYYVTVTDGITTCKDSVTITVNNLAGFNPLQDTVKVCGDSIVLDAGAGYATYNWSNGATTKTITAKASGKYYVTVATAAGCSASDTSIVSIVKAKILQRDTTICKGSSVTLVPASLKAGQTAVWSNGDTTSTISVTPTTTTKYLVTVSDGITNCKDSITVTVIDIGAFNPLQDTIKVCGDSTVLDAGSGYAAYNWSNGATTRTITAKVSGKYIVTVANASGCSVSDTSVVSIVKAKILQRDTTICKGSSLTLVPASLKTGQTAIWSNGATTNTISVTPTTTTKYIIAVTDGMTTCKDSITVTVSDIGAFNPLQDTIKVCGDSTVLDAGAGYTTYNWSNGATTRTITAKASGNYSVTVANAIGCSASDISIVSIVKAKIIQRDTTICKGSSISLAIDSTNSGQTVCSGLQLPTGLRNGLVGYFPFCGNANDASGNGNNGSVVGANLITDRFGNPNSAYNFSGTNQYISVTASNLPTTSRSTALWYKTPDPTYRGNLLGYGGNGTCGTSYFIGGTNHRGTGKLVVTGHCSANETSVAYVPQAEQWVHLVTTSSSNGTKIYINGKLVASSSQQINTTGSKLFIGCISSWDGLFPYADGNGQMWKGAIDDVFIFNRELSESEITSLYNTSPSIAVWSTGATTPSIVVNPIVKTTYKVTVSDGITTCTDSVVVNVSSSELKVTDPAAVCSPGVVNLTASAVTAGSATGLTYTYWRDANATQALANPDKVAVSGTYYIVGTSATGCTSSPTAVKVTVNPLPVATIVTPTQTTICDKSTITLTARGGTTYQWLLNGSTIAGALDSIYVASLPGNYVVNAISLGCTSNVSTPVNLSLIKAALPKFSNSSTCIDVPVSFFNETDTTSSGSVSWFWDFGDGQTSTLFNPVYTYKKTGSYNVKLTVTPKLCSSLPANVIKNITVDIPPVGIKYPNVLAVKNKATPLSARFIANGYSYLWMPSTGLNNGAIQKPIFNASNEQLYRVRLTSAGGCITMDTVKVSVYDSSDIFVPNAFSPNNDGKNDLLQPFLVNIATLKFFRVYNRWGQIMFQSSDSKQGWDGMYNYKPQPLETYTWIAEGIDGNGTTIFRKGQTVLIR